MARHSNRRARTFEGREQGCRLFFVEMRPATVLNQGGSFAAALQGTHLLTRWFSGNNLLGRGSEPPISERVSPVTC